MTWTYITSREQLNIAITNVLQSPLQWVGCDTETTGLDCHTNKVRLVQFDVEDNSYILDTWLVPTWTESFQRLIDCKTLKWAFHNFKFDLKFFWANKLDFFGCKVFDTMIASALISAGLDLPNDLAHVAERYVGIEVDKTEQKSDWSVETLTNSQLYYASKDARTTRLLGAKLVRIIYSDNLTEVFKLEMRALYSFAAMEWYGMQLDTDRLELLRPIYENNLLEAEKQFLELVPVRYERHNLLGELIDTGFKLSSSDQVLEVLRGYEIPNPLYNPDSNLEAESDPIINSTGANVVKLLDIVDYPILEALLAHRKAAKLLSAYVYSLPKLVNSVTGRVHTNYRQMVSTGRVSSSNPNLQNLSRPDGNELNLRSCFVPAPGFELVDADFSQIELRVIAEIIYSISGDDTMLQEFIAGKDPYAATAAMMASIDYSTMVYVDPNTGETKVKKEFKTLRQNAKAVRLGYNYCLSGNTLIPAERGVVRIKDITTKDKVLTHTGKYQNVLDTQKVYSNDLVKVVTSTGKVLTMTPDHKMLVILPRTNKILKTEYEWKEASKLNIGDYLVANKSEHIMPAEGYFADSRYSKVLGWFLSEGVYSNGLFYIAQDPVANSVIYQEMDNVLSSLGFFKYPSSLDRFYIHAKDRKHLMATVNIEWRHNSKQKNFTDIRDLLNRAERLDLIGALWDGDGCICVSNNRLSITYHSLSYKLITDIQYLLSSFGINSRISRRKSKLYELRIIGSTGMATFLSIVPTSKTVHANKLKRQKGLESRIKTEEKIINIDYLVVNNHPMYDITVETDHSFIANGLISHNCMGYKKFRNYAKTTYGVSMTIDEAQASRNLYFAAYPGLNVYHNQFKDKNLKTVHSLPPFSRPRHFDEYPGIPALANHPVQSTSADIQKLAQAILYESLYKLGYSPTQSSDMRMISTIHDELVSECLPHLSEQLKVLQQYSMESAAKTIIKGCPVIAEANVIANLAQKG